MSTHIIPPRTDFNQAPSFAELSVRFDAIAELMQSLADAAERDLASWLAQWKVAR